MKNIVLKDIKEMMMRVYYLLAQSSTYQAEEGMREITKEGGNCLRTQGNTGEGRLRYRERERQCADDG